MTIVNTGSCRLPARVGVVACTLLLACSFVAGCDSAGGKKGPKAEAPPDAPNAIAPIAFAETNGKDPYNASGIVPVGDSRFIFVDNNTNDALLELDLTADGKAAKPIARLPLAGLAEKSVDDIEDLALAEANGRRYIFATPSLSIKAGSKKKGKDDKARPAALLRIAIGEDGTLTTEAMTGFREWFVENVPAITPAAMNDPEYGGLNIEGLAWDPERQALLFGIRTPVVSAGPIVIPVKIKDVTGPWTTSNLEPMQPILLKVENAISDQGIRGMATGRDGKGFLVVVANATSDDEAPFAVYEWNGSETGEVKKLPYTFAKKMKPEGLAVGTVGGRPAIVFVDDNGGFQVVWL